MVVTLPNVLVIEPPAFAERVRNAQIAAIAPQDNHRTAHSWPHSRIRLHLYAHRAGIIELNRTGIECAIERNRATAGREAHRSVRGLDRRNLPPVLRTPLKASSRRH